MKNIISAFFFLLASWQVLTAQTPLPINYQAVARNASGAPLVGQNIYVRFAIHQTTAAGTVVWQEDHTSVTTNNLGLFTLNLLGGTKTGGTLGSANGILWGNNPYWLEVLVDPDAGGPSPYLNMGTTQFLSVPYAKHASSADSLKVPPPGATIWKQISDTVQLTDGTKRVGIGTNSPKAKLQISDPGSMAPTVLLETSAGSFDIGYKIKSAGGEWLLGKENAEFDMFKIRKINDNVTGFSMLGGLSPKIGIGTSDPQDFFHVRVDKDFTFDSSLVVMKNGNVGIGIINPGNQLQVESNRSAQRYAGQFHNTATTGPANLTGAVFGYTDAVNPAAVSKYGGIFQASEGAGTNYGVKGEAFNGTGTNIGGYFNAVGGTNNYAAIFNSGNVGIGTSTPAAKLHMNGGHLKSTQAVTPTFAVVSGGNFSGVSLDASSTDVKGVIRITAGSLPAGISETYRITFNTAYNSAPIVVVTPSGNAATSARLSCSVSATTTDVVIYVLNNSTAGGVPSPVNLNYFVIE